MGTGFPNSIAAVAGVVSIYSVWDMLRYNRARRAEWVEAQKKFEADELATARLAYLKGEATEDQIILVEEANREAEETGIKLPPLLSPPEHRTHFEEHVKPAIEGKESPEKSQGKGILGFFSGLTGSKEEPAQSSTASDSSSVSSESSPTNNSDVVRTIEDKAKQAWQTEKDNQRRGGSLDQLGLETGSQSQGSSKKGWWPW